MKRLLLILICLFVSFEVKSKKEDILCKSLTKSDDFFYKKFSTKKFSGNCVEFSENGQIIEKRKIKGGVLLKSERFNIVDKVPSVLNRYRHEHLKIHHITVGGNEIPVYLQFDKCESDFKNNSEFKKCKILLNKKIELDRYYCDNEMVTKLGVRCENILKLQLEFESKLIDNVLVSNITKYEYCKLGYIIPDSVTTYSVENEVECFKVEEYFSSKKRKLCKPLENLPFVDSGMYVSFRCEKKFDPLGCDRRYLKENKYGQLINKRKDQKMLCDPEGVKYCEPESFYHLRVDDTTCKKEKSLDLFYEKDEKGKKRCEIWDDLSEKNYDEGPRYSEICKYKKEVKSWKKNNF